MRRFRMFVPLPTVMVTSGALGYLSSSLWGPAGVVLVLPLVGALCWLGTTCLYLLDQEQWWEERDRRYHEHLLSHLKHLLSHLNELKRLSGRSA